MWPDEIDLFTAYRTLLALICTVYAILVMTRSLGRWLTFFKRSRATQVLGRYTGTLLLRTRFRRFGWDLCQIALLAGVLAFLIGAHWMQ